MRVLLPTGAFEPLHDTGGTRRLEAAAANALPFHTLMQRAGDAASRLVRAVAPHADCIWVAAGAGNNGGDGIVAATLLRRAGWNAKVTLVAMPSQPDAKVALERALAEGVPVSRIEAGVPKLGPQDLAIDALLGLGAARAPSGSMAALIERINHLPCPVLALDLPSGLHPDTGQTLGDACVRADHTLTLLTAKPGLFTAQGRDHSGRVWLDDLQVDSAAEPATAWLGGKPDFSAFERRHSHHKGSYGDVAIVGGALGMTGAAWLAARAAHAAGAGRVLVDLPADDGEPQTDWARPELMLRRGWWREEASVLQNATVVCGCGGGEAVREALPRLLSLAHRLVLDADALNAVAADRSLKALLAARRSRSAFTVITPHPLEAARLLGSTAADVQANRLAAAQTLAKDLRCVVLLKGSGSVIVAPGLRPLINPTGNASLATAGTGDVLAGWMGGRWSALGPTSTWQSAFDLAALAAWEHGAAADPVARGPLRAADLVDRLHLQARTQRP